MTRPKQPRSTSGIPPQTAQTILNLLDRNQWDQVEPLLIKLRQKHGDDFRLLVWHGDTLRGLERFPEAITLYRQALELEPQNNESLTLSLAMCLRKEGQLDEALRLSGQVIQLRPDYAGAWALQGGYLQGSGAADPSPRCLSRSAQTCSRPLECAALCEAGPVHPAPPRTRHPASPGGVY
ncbi:tetratricopeptide repeat protein [Alcaligenes faecalis]|uniref:tetratricopeptide repeat protein n=1 Tax=Alcaligenes faecalis TaxID=511 RepID=UPI0024BD1097|nr:tetratricopeptide repeat protein [Alcaligenes faecalis]